MGYMTNLKIFIRIFMKIFMKIKQSIDRKGSDQLLMTAQDEQQS